MKTKKMLLALFIVVAITSGCDRRKIPEGAMTLEITPIRVEKTEMELIYEYTVNDEIIILNTPEPVTKVFYQEASGDTSCIIFYKCHNVGIDKKLFVYTPFSDTRSLGIAGYLREGSSHDNRIRKLVKWGDKEDLEKPKNWWAVNWWWVLIVILLIFGAGL